MSLRVKLLLAVALTTAILLVTFLIFTRFILTDSYAHLEQADTAEHIARFEAFQQGSTPAQGRYKGLGLGLSIVKHLVTLMGGEVKLDSTVGYGTTFTIVLPLSPETNDQA